MSLRTQSSWLDALTLAFLLLLAGCATTPDDGDQPTRADTQPGAARNMLVWDIIDGSILRGNAFTGLEYVRFMRPVAVAARGPYIYIVDDGLGKLFLYDRDTRDLTVLKDLRQLVSGEVTDIFVNQDLSYYLADRDGGRVLHFNREGKLIREFRDPINLGRPVAVVQDQAAGWVYIADGFNDDVLVYNRAGQLVGAIGIRGSEPGKLRGVTGFALGPEGYYVTTRFGEFRVQVFDEDGVFLKGFQKDTVIFPLAIAVDSQNRAFVGDYLNNTIKVYVDGVYVYSLGVSGAAPGQFKRITDLWLDDGFLYVADSLNGRIQVLKVTPETLQKARTPQ